MNLLLDTHALLWFIRGDDRLGIDARALIEHPDHRRLVSTASPWEMAIKASIKKLRIPLPIERLASEHIVGNGMEVLGLSAAHFDELMGLPMHHRDPFDRLLIAQARVEGAVLLSRDENFTDYDVETKW